MQLKYILGCGLKRPKKLKNLIQSDLKDQNYES